MKKENRKMAQERRAQERKKEEQKKKVKKYLSIGIPVLLIVVLVAAIAVSSAREKQREAEEQAAAEAAAAEAEAAEEEALEEEEVLNTDTSLVVADGDTVNIDYVGSIDGVEFDGGNTQGMGADLVIGSGRYIDDFEEQLIGHNVGETVEVVVTFPEDYGNEELNGKEAVFETVINGIYGPAQTK